MKKKGGAKIKPLTGNHGDFSGIALKAAARGDLAAVRHYLSLQPSWLDEEGPHGRTLLWEAAYKGRTEVVRELLARGAKPSTLGSYYTPMLVELSPLAVARMGGHDEVVELLKKHRASDDFYAACHRGDLAAMKRFLRRKPALVNRPARDVEPHPFMGYHPVHYAVAGKQLAALELLAERGADLASHMPLLMKWAGDSRTIRRRLRELAPGAKTSFPKTALQKKARTNKKGRTPAIDQPNDMGFPPLVEACRGNHNAPDHPERVEALLDRGADLAAKDYKGKTALHRAAQAGFVKITRLLLRRGADRRALDDDGLTPAFAAARHGRTATLALLATRKADLRAVDRRGETLLFAAARGGHDETVEALLERGCDPEHQNAKGRTVAAIVAASRHQTPGRRRILELLDAAITAR